MASLQKRGTTTFMIVICIILLSLFTTHMVEGQSTRTSPIGRLRPSRFTPPNNVANNRPPPNFRALSPNYNANPPHLSPNNGGTYNSGQSESSSIYQYPSLKLLCFALSSILFIIWW